jgi:dTDP-glucose 4,6-dehydratase
VILGAAGFLGSHLCEHLIRTGYLVVGIDDLSSSNGSNIESLYDSGQLEFIQHDICNPLQVSGDVDFVLNFASLASPPQYLLNPLHTLRTGSLGTDNAIELAIAKDARFIMASTSEIYGEPLQHPQHESYWGNVNPIGDRSCYDEAKRYAEALCFAHKKTQGLNFGLIRIFNTYGPRLDPRDGRVVSNFIVQALNNEPLTIHGEGTQTRSFCYVDDLIEGVIAMMNCDENGPINLGNPTEISVYSLAQLVIELVQSQSAIKHLPRLADDPSQRRPDISLARQALDWEPNIGLAEGLQNTIEWFQQKIGNS